MLIRRNWRPPVGCWVLAIGMAAGLLAATKAGADPVDDCDRNGDGVVDQAELRPCLLKAKKAGVADVDTNGDGEVSRKEVESVTADWLDELLLATGHAPPYSARELREYLRIEPKRSTGGFLVRRNPETITFTDRAKPADKAEGALFAFSRDEVKDVSTWQAKGAVMRPIRLDDPQQRAAEWLSGLALVPSISFERVGADGGEDGKDGSDEPDSLTGRLGVVVEIFDQWVRIQTIQLSAAYASDFDLESGVLAGELSWEPTHNAASLGVFRPVGRVGSPLELRWRFVAAAQFGRVLDAGDKENLVEDEEFLRIGPKLLVELRWSGSPVSARVGYDYLKGLRGEPDHVELFKGGLSVKLDREGRFTLEVLYQNGQIPLTLEETEVLSTGFGVKL